MARFKRKAISIQVTSSTGCHGIGNVRRWSNQQKATGRNTPENPEWVETARILDVLMQSILISNI